MFLVSTLTILDSQKNSFAIMRMMVYAGTATIMPSTPKSVPPMSVTVNISIGWAFTEFENISGCDTKLSNSCMTMKPPSTHSVTGISSPIGWEILLSIVSDTRSTPPIKGPMYGTMLRSATINAIINGFCTPKLSKSMSVKQNISDCCTNSPITYRESRLRVFCIMSDTFFFRTVGNYRKYERRGPAAFF